MTPDSVKADYRSALKETVTIRRFTGAGPARPKFEARARARVTGYEAKELVGAVVQGDRKVIVYADDLIDNGLALPVTTNDLLVLSSGKQLAIVAADDQTRKVAGVLIALEIQARG